MSDNIAQYKKLREELKTEYEGMQARIMALVERQIELKELLYPNLSAAPRPITPAKKADAKKPARKAPVKKAAAKKPARKAPAKAAVEMTVKENREANAQKNQEKSEALEQRLIRIVRAKPGASRQYILDQIKLSRPEMTESTFRNLLSRASSKGLIVNKGNNRSSRWHLTPKSI